MLEILRTHRRVKITHLIYKANLSNNSIKPYLEELIGKKLIEEVDVEGKRHYTLTQKGHEFLDEFNKIKIFSDAYGL